MSFMGRLDTPSFVADLNAWIVVLCSEHAEEYRETVDRPDIVGDHTHVACLLLPFVIFLHCSSSTSR